MALRALLPKINIVAGLSRILPAAVWKDLRTPATDGRIVAVGGSGLGVWDIKRNQGVMSLAWRGWDSLPRPGVCDVHLLPFDGGSTALLSVAEYQGEFSTFIVRDARPHDFEEFKFSRSPTKQLLAVDESGTGNWIHWSGEGPLTVYGRDLKPRASISTDVGSGQELLGLSYRHPYLSAVVRDQATLSEAIHARVLPGGPWKVIAQAKDLAVSLNDDGAAWSQRATSKGYVDTCQLYYRPWTQDSKGGTLLFTPELHTDLKFPVVAGTRIVFGRRWPVGRGGIRKTEILAYEWSKLLHGDPTVLPIRDGQAWDDRRALHSASYALPAAAFFQESGGRQPELSYWEL